MRAFAAARLTPARIVLVLILLATLGFFALRPVLIHHPARSGGAVGLTDLQDIQQLQTRFNDDAGTTRLVLLLSPT